MPRQRGWLRREIEMEHRCLDAAREGRSFQWVRFALTHKGIRCRIGSLIDPQTTTDGYQAHAGDNAQ